MEANYQYCRDQVIALLREQAAHGAGEPLRALDYGCGAAQVVRALRDKGVDAYGADVFYEGGSLLPAVERDPLFQAGVIRHMTSDRTEFPDAFFDVVFSNQVLEHVVALEPVVAEMARVLKPGGVVLSLFPDRAVWREGHIGIPFSHRLSPGPFRLSYARALRSAGLGYHKDTAPSAQAWAEKWLDWIDKWTYYRTYAHIMRAFGAHFVDIRRIEDGYLDYRLGLTRLAPLAPLVRPAPARPLARWFIRRMTGLVFLARKPLTPPARSA